MSNIKKEFKKEIEKLRNMSFKDKLWYIKEYYTIPIIGTIVAIFIIFSAINLIAKKPPVLSAFFVNTPLIENNMENLKDNFYTYSGLNKKDEMLLDTSMFIDIKDEKNLIGYEYIMKLSAMVSGASVDAIVCDEPIFWHFVDKTGFASNIKNIIPKDILDIFKNDIVYNSKNIPVGINISSAPTLNKYFDVDNAYIIIPENSHNINNAISFLKFLYDI